MVKALKPKKINLGADEIKKRVIEMKSNNKKVSQVDMETPGGFENTDAVETEKIIAGKMRERIRLQEQLRELEIAQSYRNVEVEELEILYHKLEENLKKKPETMTESDFCYTQGYLPKWFGLPMPKRILIMELNTKIHQWKGLMQQRNYLYKALKNVGFTTNELNPLLIDGKIVSDTELMKKLEKEYNDKKLKRDDVDAV